MSQHEDVLAKMDALLNKHHDAFARESVMDDFPVLTEVLEVQDEALIPILTEEVTPPLNDEALRLLDRQIREALEHRLPFHVIEAVDKALPIVLEALSRQLETMVRDAVTQVLQQQRAKAPQQGDVPK